LPSAKKRGDIITALKNDQVLVVTGETGCGKTTQVPQFIMEELGGECFIVCTQPRRISAIGVATRVAQERGESIDGRTSSIGYSVRGASRRTSKTRLLFCTTGVLLRRMQQQDMLLDGRSTNGRPAVKITHVIVDEVHERSLDSDHLLTLLRDILPFRPDIKVILMSATINAERFAAYFGGCGIQHIPGFTHPVEQFFLEDVLEFTGHKVRGKHDTSGGSKDRGKLTEDELGSVHSFGSLRQSGKYNEVTIESLKCVMGNEEQINSVLACKLIIKLGQRILETAKQTTGKGGGQAVTGAVLVFLPGLRDIRGIHDILTTGRGRFRGSDLDPAEAAIASEILYPLMLHSTVPPRDQARVFQRPPRGLVKVVLSTNIAETSITIDDVVCVVDTLRVNETGFDPVNGIACLKEQWCSQAAHRQRAGRAGRVRAGECWSLVTKKRHDNCAPFEQPEIFRVPLDQLYLKIESSLANGAAATTKLPSSVGKGKTKPKPAKNAHEVLQRFMDPPTSAAIMGALDSLKEVGALDGKRKLTPLGHHLAYIPIDLRLAKILLYGAIFRCVDPAASIVACIGAGRSPLLNPPDKREEAKEAHKQFVVRYSDHLTLLRVYEAWTAVPTRERRRWCGANFLSDTSLQEIATLRKQLLAALMEMGFLPNATKEKWNQHSKYPKVRHHVCFLACCLLPAAISSSFAPFSAR
jgi:HrpA-like RNA helicase